MTFNLLPSERAIHNVTFPSEKQAIIWKQKQDGYSTTEIAHNFNASLAYVSKAIRVTNKKIEVILQDVARSNMIELSKLDTTQGFAYGFSPMLNRKAYISFTPKLGAHVWYDHEANCENCPALNQCRALIEKESEERGIEIPIDLERETERAEYIIEKIFQRIGWKFQ